MTLREAWISRVTPEDYEAHMARVGQAEANALLVRTLLSQAEIATGSRVLVAGAGTGQMFDHMPPQTFAPYHLVCSDISPTLLERLRLRVACETVLDDVEDTKLESGCGAIVLVLVLEHVDFRKALASLTSLRPDHFLIVIQENPPSMTEAMTPGRTPPGSMRVFAEEARPHLVPFADLAGEMASHGYILEHRQDAPVADGKKMIGTIFRRR
jgi:SAM-dependent methyltransferase